MCYQHGMSSTPGSVLKWRLLGGEHEALQGTHLPLGQGPAGARVDLRGGLQQRLEALLRSELPADLDHTSYLDIICWHCDAKMSNCAFACRIFHINYNNKLYDGVAS